MKKQFFFSYYSNNISIIVYHIIKKYGKQQKQNKGYFTFLQKCDKIIALVEVDKSKLCDIIDE